MKSINKFWWFVAAASAITCIALYSFGWLFWQQECRDKKGFKGASDRVI
jgi:hypothetical protein